MNTALEKLVFNVGGKMVELTDEEARSLKIQLDSLYGSSPQTPQWYSPPPTIVIREHPYSPPYLPWCGGTICQSVDGSRSMQALHHQM